MAKSVKQIANDLKGKEKKQSSLKKELESIGKVIKKLKADLAKAKKAEAAAKAKKAKPKAKAKKKARPKAKPAN